MLRGYRLGQVVREALLHGLRIEVEPDGIRLTKHDRLTRTSYLISWDDLTTEELKRKVSLLRSLAL